MAKKKTKLEKVKGTPYVPFGEEWEKSMMRMSKATIVRMYRKVCIEKLQLEKKMKDTK